MRIVHVTTVPQTLTFFPGQVGFMKRAGATVYAVSSPGLELQAFAHRNNVETRAIPMLRQISPSHDVRAVLQLYRAFRQIRPDVLHASTPKAALLAITAGWLAGVPVRIFHILGLPHLAARGGRRIALLASTYVSCLLANRVFCVSPSMALAARHYPGGNKTFTPGFGSPDGIDAENRFNPEKIPASGRHDFRARLGIPTGALVVLYMGRLVRDKGIVELAAAWTHVEKEHGAAYLVLAGNDEPHDPLPAETIAALRQSPRVKFSGFLEQTEIAYASADVLVLPTYREGFGCVLAEASAMQLPVVATAVPGCVDAVADGVTGTLIPPRDAGALAAAISRYLADPALRHLHGSAGRTRVLELFRPEPIWQQTYAEYKVLLQKRQRRAYRMTKRALDWSAALALLVLLSPLLIAIACLVRWRIGGPVLFRQSRPGLHGEPFTIYKFRTMRDLRDACGNLLPDDRRLSAFGQFLRSASLDELPELWNVLKGEMSLVGPRPLLMEYLPLYSAGQNRRHEVRPGITGWAQVNGRNGLGWDDKFKLDVWYVENRSLLLDTHILWRTVLAVFRRDGIAHGGHVSMPLFLGSKEQHCND